MKNNTNTITLRSHPSIVILEQENSPSRRRVSSGELFGKQQELVIEHNDEEYRLRITSNDKLILTK
jgi:hemin uptake protein HemP